jgi:hypothetical protein
VGEHRRGNTLALQAVRHREGNLGARGSVAGVHAVRQDRVRVARDGDDAVAIGVVDVGRAVGRGAQVGSPREEPEAPRLIRQAHDEREQGALVVRAERAQPDRRAAPQGHVCRAVRGIRRGGRRHADRFVARPCM